MISTQRIEASFDTLLHQAWKTAGLYLANAIREIDAAFDTPGYAKAHPELVAAFMQTAATDFHSSSFCVALQNVADALEPLDAIGCEIQGLKLVADHIARNGLLVLNDSN